MKKTLLIALLSAMTAISWAVTPGKWYAITLNGKGIIIPEASQVTNVQLKIWSQTNVPSQLWYCIDNGDGSLSFRSGYLGEYLCHFGTARAGVKITARTEETKNKYAFWTLQAVDGKTDVYRIMSTNGACVVGAASAEDDAKLTLVDQSTASADLTEWTFTEYTGTVSTSFDENARDAIIDNYIAQYYHTASPGCVLGGGGWWGDAEMFETILDAFETTGDKKYQTYFSKLVTNFVSDGRNKTNWSYNEYNDDITWMILACIRGYKYFNSSNYLKYAKDNFDRMYERALEEGGSLRWKQATESWNGTNSCINCPATVAACYLYEMTGDEAYLEKAKSLYAVQRKILFNPSTGQVYDSGTWNSTWTGLNDVNQWASTYNQGTMLGAATKLYILTGEEQYKTDAQKVWEYTYNHLTNSNKIVHVCQVATGDLCGFKGILMRYVRLYGQTFGDEDVFEWMEKNAWYAFQNANSKGVIWSRWLYKTPEDFIWVDGNKGNDFSNDAFGASTAVSVAFNAHVNRRFHKDAYSLIGAEVFDDINFMQISNNCDDDGTTPNTTRASKGYICFKNVDFGTEGATGATLRLYSSSATGSYGLYVDKVSPDTKIGTVTDMQFGWNTYFINVTKTTGTHSVYAVPETTANTMFHNIIFSTAASGIEMVDIQPASEPSTAVYNLAGQRLAAPRKGINVINGRKVLVK